MITNLVTFREEPLSDSRKTFDLASKHEERSDQIVLGKNIKNLFSISRRTVIKSQRDGTSIAASVPRCPAQPLRAHTVRGVIDSHARGNQQPTPNQRNCSVE